MSKVYTTREEITELGRTDAIEAIRDSGSTDAPDGGWDSWILAGLGYDETIRAFGESVEENQDGWSPTMAEKLRWYNEGALAAAEELTTNEDAT